MKIWKLLIITSTFISLLPACNSSTSPSPVEKEDTTSTAEIIHRKPEYAYPVKYTEWEIGDPAKINTVIDCYKAWDDRDTAKFPAFFSDTVILRLPNESRQIEIPNNKISGTLNGNRGMYKSTSNNIISAISLHDRESGEDWVMITTYNKWEEKNGHRDSLLLHEDWLLKDGKIKMLMSYSKTPTKTFLQNFDKQPK